MNDLTQNISKELNLDRSNWELVRFGDIAIQQKKSVDRDKTSLTRYVKGEHMGTEDLHLREWGELTDEYLGPAFIRKFETGDILYGSRRTYLKKVAIAHFEGITSNTTFVIKANEKKIDKRLLPFIMLSEGFTEHSIKNSKGSVNPYINWKDIANYEFLLPPKDQQTQIAELLWAMDEVIEKELALIVKLNNTYNLLVNNLFLNKHDTCDYLPLKEVATINSKTLSSKTDPNYVFKYLDIASIIEPKTIGELTSMKFSESPSRARRVISNNSIVLSLVRPYQKSFVYIENSNDIIASTGTGVVDILNNHNPKFIFHQFFSDRFLKYCENKMTGTNYPAITPSDLAEYKVVIPKRKELEIIETEKLDSIENCLTQQKRQLHNSKELQKNLINQIF